MIAIIWIELNNVFIITYKHSSEVRAIKFSLPLYQSWFIYSIQSTYLFVTQSRKINIWICSTSDYKDIFYVHKYYWDTIVITVHFKIL